MNEFDQLAWKAANILEGLDPGYFGDEIIFWVAETSNNLRECNEVFPVNLEALLSDRVDDGSVLHDVCGINRHWNAESSSFQGCFWPRCML